MLYFFPASEKGSFLPLPSGSRHRLREINLTKIIGFWKTRDAPSGLCAVLSLGGAWVGVPSESLLADFVFLVLIREDFYLCGFLLITVSTL